MLAELFATEVRYSGASLGYQLGAIVGGGADADGGDGACIC